MSRADSRYFRTAAKMDEALLALLEQKDLAYITVREICARAGVNRSTFYLHYETVSDLLTESVEYVKRRFLERYPAEVGILPDRLRDCSLRELYLMTPAYLEPWLSFVRDNRRLYRTLMERPAALRLGHTYDQMFRYVFAPILERYHVPGPDRNYMMAFYIRGVTAIVAEWLKNDCTEPVGQIVGIIQRCIPPPTEE